MKRTALARRTPLEAKAPLRRTAAIARSPLARSALHARKTTELQQPKRRTANPQPGVPTKVRRAVAERSGGWCEIDAPGCSSIATDFAHRKKVGAGGRKGATAKAHHVPSNALAACRACHSFCHRYPTAAYAAGWMLTEQQHPATTPVVYRGSWRWLTDEGAVSTTPPPSEEATMTTEHSHLDAAILVAPQPTSMDATPEAWARHYAGLALAAYADFRTALQTVTPDTHPGSRPELGHLSLIAVTATAAAVSLIVDDGGAPTALWLVTPEAGSLNGEGEEWLTATLDKLGVNPADIDPAYNAGDFGSPSLRQQVA